MGSAVGNAGVRPKQFDNFTELQRTATEFELQELTSNVLRDLNLDYNDKKVVLENYIYYLISVSINHPETYSKTLQELKIFVLT